MSGSKKVFHWIAHDMHQHRNYTLPGHLHHCRTALHDRQPRPLPCSYRREHDRLRVCQTTCMNRLKRFYFAVSDPSGWKKRAYLQHPAVLQDSYSTAHQGADHSLSRSQILTKYIPDHCTDTYFPVHMRACRLEFFQGAIVFGARLPFLLIPSNNHGAHKNLHDG